MAAGSSAIDRRALGIGIAGFAAFLDLYATQGMLPYLSREFQVSALEASATVSATTTAVALSAPLAGCLADRIGRKRVIVAAALCLALPTLLAATAADLQALVWWRALQGLCLPAIFAASVAYVGEECGARVGRTMAAYVTGNILGGVLGRFVAAFVADGWGFREAFLVLGGLNVAAAAGLWWVLPASRNFRPERRLLPMLRQLGAHLKNPRLLAGYAAGFSILFSIVGAFTYVGYHLSAPPFNLSTTLLGAVFFVYLAGTLVTPLAGRVLDRWGPRRVLIYGVLLASLGMTLTLIPLLAVVVLGLALCAAGTFVCQAASNSYLAASSGRARSLAAGVYVSIYYLGGTAGTVLPGIAWRNGGWPECVALIVAVQAATAAIAWLSWRPEHTPQVVWNGFRVPRRAGTGS